MPWGGMVYDGATKQMNLIKSRRGPEPGIDPALVGRLRAIVGRGKTETAAYPDPPEPTEPMNPVQRRFWTPLELADQK